MGPQDADIRREDRRNLAPADDDRDVAQKPGEEDAPAAVLALYDSALPEVYGYFLRRCGGREVAEELTSETFLAAVDAARKDAPPPIALPWVMGVARHKLVDHWRRQARAQRDLQAVADTLDDGLHDPWDARLDAVAARATLEALSPTHRLALTLRYVDDLAVADVADLLGRSLHATEALLVRARAAFRRAYCSAEGER